MFYLSGKNSDSSNNGHPPYFEYINCLPYLQGSSPLLQTWSTCNKSCGDNNWKPIRDVCVANAGTVDFNYSFIRTRTSGTDNQEMFNCAYGGETVFGYTGRAFDVDESIRAFGLKSLAADTVVAYSTGTIGANADDSYTTLHGASTGRSWHNDRDQKSASLFIETTGGLTITGITGMTGGFGVGVSHKNDIVAVGAYLDGYRADGVDVTKSTGEFGKVYIYNTGGHLVNEIYPPQGHEPDAGSAISGPSGARGFGHSVAIINNDNLLIGAPWTSGFYNTTPAGAPTSPGWIDKAGAAYIYSTGGELLHTLTGETGNWGLSADSLHRRMLGWQGVANESSIITASPGLKNYSSSGKQIAFYEAEGAYIRSLGPNYSTEGFAPDTVWTVSAFSLASNSESFFINSYVPDAASPVGLSSSIKAFGNDGLFTNSIMLPRSATAYAGVGMDASDKFLVIGDIVSELGTDQGKVYIMETGDLFLKEISSPSSIPGFGVQVAAARDYYTTMNASGLMGYELSGVILFNEFTGQVGSGFDQWKGLFEHTFTGVTLNFVNLGLETGTDISSNSEQPEYPLDSHIGNIRIGMEPGLSPATAYCPQGTMNTLGLLGGDIHLDEGGAWRQDGTPIEDATTDAYSIVYAVSQAIGSSLGFGTDSSPGALMYDEIKPEFTFTEKFPNGLSGSIYEENAVMGIYGV